MRTFLLIALFGVATFFCSCFLVVLMHRSSNEVVAQWQQPASIDYQSFGPYYLSVIRRDLDWSGFPLFVSRNYAIYVGRDSGTPGYGHLLDHSFHPSNEDSNDPESHIRKSSAEWDEKGVTFIEASGHRLFVPKDMFIGGR